MSLLPALAGLAVLVPLVHAALSDLRHRRIPNAAVLALMAGAPFWHLALGLGWQATTLGLLAALVIFVPALFAWRAGLLGGGDVKLLTVAVLLATPAHLAELLLVTALAGGLLALGVLARRELWRPDHPRFGPLVTALACRTGGTLTGCSENGASVPYGVAIAAGAVVVLATQWSAT